MTQSSYDAANRLDCTAVRMNAGIFGSLLSPACSLGTQGSYGPDRITKSSYDNANRMTAVTEAYGVTGQQRDTVTSAYTDNGQVLTVKDAKSNLTTYVYDGVDRLSRIRYPDPATINSSSTTDYEERGYDANSNVTNLRTRSAQTIALTYDNLNRLTVKDLPGGTAEDVYLAYDNVGQMTSALYDSTSGSGVTQAWDALGRMTSQTSYGRQLSYLYDAAGNRTRITWPDGFCAVYDYNAAYLVSTIHDAPACTSSTAIVSFGYDDLARRASLSRSNGATTSYTFDSVSRLDTLVQKLSGTAADYSASFAYNASSQIRSRTQANDASYAWKGAANQSVVYGVNGLNQVSNIQGINLSYDANGNLTRGAASYTYDVENKLRSASEPTPVTIDYDPLGRLKQTASSSATTVFLYDGSDLVSEYAGSSLTKRYVHGPGIDELLVAYDANGNRSWLHADERGSVIATSDAAGNVGPINSYSPDGQPANWTVSRFGYTGQIAIPEAALWHYKARAYAPRMARFLQTDPIGYAAGMNLYAYVRGDPVNLIDPFGLAEVCGGSTGLICEELEVIPVTGQRLPPRNPEIKDFSCSIFCQSFSGVPVFYGDGERIPQRPALRAFPTEFPNTSVSNPEPNPRMMKPRPAFCATPQYRRAADLQALASDLKVFGAFAGGASVALGATGFAAPVAGAFGVAAILSYGSGSALELIGSAAAIASGEERGVASLTGGLLSLGLPGGKAVDFAFGALNDAANPSPCE